MNLNLQGILENYFSNKSLNIKDKNLVYNYMFDCILKAKDPIITKPFTSFSKNLLKFLEISQCYFNLESLLKKQLKGKKLIELGPGARPLADWAFEYDIAEYIGVEPFNPEITEGMLPKDKNVKLEKEKEALEFLLGQKNESSVIISMGVLCQELFNFNNDNYFRFIIKEIYRVTPKDSPSIHLIGAINNHRDYFIESGFKTVTDLESNFIYIK